jgi:biopolymer transport protein ExbB
MRPARAKAAQRAQIVNLEMRRGLSALATIASTAPLLGHAGTVLSFPLVFKGCPCGDQITVMTRMLGELADHLILTVLGLLVALPALWFYRYLSARAETFQEEMVVAVNWWQAD